MDVWQNLPGNWFVLLQKKNSGGAFSLPRTLHTKIHLSKDFILCCPARPKPLLDKERNTAQAHPDLFLCIIVLPLGISSFQTLIFSAPPISPTLF
jgi:hypothetical protein